MNIVEELNECNHDLTSLSWKQLELTDKKGNLNIIEGIARVLYFFLSSFKHLGSFKKHEVVALCEGKNNLEVLEKVIPRNVSVFTLHRFNPKRNDFYRLPEYLFYICGIFNLYKIAVYKIKEKSKYRMWVLNKRLDRFLLAAGARTLWSFLFKVWKTKRLIVTNDHSVWGRSALYAANKLNIETIYIPHAPLGKNQPKQLAKYVFFNGLVQLDCFNEELHNSNVYIMGTYQNWPFSKEKQLNKSKALICLNTMDDFDSILNQAQRVKNVDLVIRPHPADINIDLYEQKCLKVGIKFSNPRNSGLTQELPHFNFLIAGESGSQVDALDFNIMPLALSSRNFKDYYQLEKNGLLKVIKELSDLENLSLLTPDLDQVKLYNNAINFESLNFNDLLKESLSHSNIEEALDFVAKKHSATWETVRNCKVLKED